jgi:hypothetical protein
VASVRLAVEQAFDAQRDEQRRREAMVAAGCAAVAVVVALLLLPLGTRTDARSEEASPLTLAPPVVAAEPVPVVQAEPVAAVEAARPAPSVASPEGTADDLPGRDRRRSPELRAAADLCTDFARLRDARNPALLRARGAPARRQRAHRVDRRSAWQQADTDLRARLPRACPLAPSGHRTDRGQRHCGGVPARADRNRQDQRDVAGRDRGAVAGAGRVHRVVAAEVRHGREASETSRAVARILAAQMSTLLGTTAQDHTQHAVGAP